MTDTTPPNDTPPEADPVPAESEVPESAPAAVAAESPADEAVSDATVPDATVPDATVPDATVPDATVPDATVPDEAVVDAAGAEQSAAALPALDEGGALPYQPGDIVPGTVTAVRDDGMDVDLDTGRRAVVPKAEMATGAAPSVGELVEGQVIRRQGNGRYVISPRRAARSRAWTKLVGAFESGEVVSGKVIEATKGGLIVDLGLRAFLPESLIDVRRVNKPNELIGQVVSVVVIECTKNADRPGERIVVSRKPIREKERSESRVKLMNDLAPGERRRGRVSALVPFGAFVDLGGVEGLVHVSELAHRQVARPDDVVAVGDEIDVVVLEVNTERRKIALSRKRALPDPWQSFQVRHQVGDLVFGTVTGLAPFGAFVALEGEELEGLVHISELSRFRVEDASEVVNVGEGVWVKVLEITPEKKRLALSLRRALE